MKYDFSKTKNKVEETKAFFKREIASLRTGRASPVLVEDILVDSYGSKLPIKHVASISVEDAKTLRITPWDMSVIKNIESAISGSNLGIQPIADKQSIRVSVPQLSEERRKALLKILSEKHEEAKISLRQERDETWKDIQDREKRKEMSEDEKFRYKDELQNLIDRANEELENLSDSKKSEISN
ncbi:MAG: ribosome recycling factor [Parcubacteria group bacterium Athens0714_24]|nr:MAG: ribosome recycling factor [Parcubacteria group bacterium Athens0714_24]